MLRRPSYGTGLYPSTVKANFSCSVPMRYCDVGLQPSANHATSASRVSIGVMSIWSRAISVTSHFAYEAFADEAFRLRALGRCQRVRTLTGGERKGNGRPPHHL